MLWQKLALSVKKVLKWAADTQTVFVLPNSIRLANVAESQTCNGRLFHLVDASKSAHGA